MTGRFFIFFAVIISIAAIGLSVERSASSAPSRADIQGLGTAGRIAKWTASDTIGDSAMIEDSGRVGVGATPPSTARLYAINSSPSISSSAIQGQHAGSGRGVYGISVSGIGVNGSGHIGVNGISTSTNPADAAVRGIAQYGPGTAKAGLFQGDVQIYGTLIKSAGSFRIDHPLDPENKYLSHSFVESPDMMNIYNGNVTTDGNGYAKVAMPDYFEALNRDFRYQLTIVGAEFAQARVAEKIRGNTFAIRTDKPNVEVSWQVTGVRQDKFANDHRIQVESKKE